jgi:hypothetical protein
MVARALSTCIPDLPDGDRFQLPRATFSRWQKTNKKK